MESEYICKLFKKCGTNRYCKENDANKCPYYRFDKTKYEYYSSSIKPFEEAETIDIWMSSDWK